MAHVVVISDIHGNLAALEAVWKDIERRRPDHILFLGDLVAFGPEPAGTLAFLRDVIQPSAALRGNTDRYLLEKPWKAKSSKLEPEIIASLAWTAEQIGEEGLAYLAGLSEERSYSVADVEVYLCHASPGNDELAIGSDSVDELAESLRSVKTDLLLCGHSHLPYRSRRTGLEVLNVGSVGFPFDRDVRGAYLSFWVGDGQLQELTFCRVSYNRARAIDGLANSDMPTKELFIHRLEVARMTAPRVEPEPESDGEP